MHRRKGSKDDLDLPPKSSAEHASNGDSTSLNGEASSMNGNSSIPPRARTTSNPGSGSAPLRTMSIPPARAPPPSAGPFRTSFSVPGPPNGYAPPPPASASPYIRSFAPSPLPPAPNSAGLSASGHGHHGHAHSRARSVSGFAPASPSPLSASFSLPPSASNEAIYGNGVPPSPLGNGMPPRSAGHGHNRTRSTVVPASNGNGLLSPTSANGMTPSFTVPAMRSLSGGKAPSEDAKTISSLTTRPPSLPTPGPPSSRNNRHTRLHSRNLSLYFPQPGSLPQHAIAEDGAQELSIDSNEPPVQAPVQIIPAASSSPIHPRRLGEGFTFGARPPSSSSPSNGDTNGPSPAPARAQRRGHHHKHSLSHNFFSFLEPGQNGSEHRHDEEREEELVTNPTPVPQSPWAPISPFPSTPAAHGQNGFSRQQEHQHQGDVDLNTDTDDDDLPRKPKHSFVRAPPLTRPSHSVRSAPARFSWTSLPTLAMLGQFALGAHTWAAGQGAGSLALTGLGYWVVFDSFGVGVRSVLPGWLERARRRSAARIGGCMYGPARTEALFLFAQAVYLLFAAVYVCKETAEHLLLSLGQEGKEGHHHHAGDEDAAASGIRYPLLSITLAVLALLGTAVGVKGGASGMADAANVRWGLPRKMGLESEWVTDPYTLVPALFGLALLGVSLILPAHEQLPADLGLALLLAAVTFALAYPACVALGAVLLQTAPARGEKNGVMESVLRTMRDIERHPQILHLPAPHVWNLAPQILSGSSAGTGPTLVVTLELHVPRDTDDKGVLELTKWARERVLGAVKGRSGLGVEGCEVTVGVVRG